MLCRGRPSDCDGVEVTILKTDHEKAVAVMKRRFLIWTAAMLAFFCAILGGVVYQIDRNATESCAATN